MGAGFSEDLTESFLPFLQVGRRNLVAGITKVFGDNVFLAPNCTFATAGHPLDIQQRNQGLEYAYPITVGDNVWIGAGVTVLPGVTIGAGSVIGAGSLVNRDIPAGVLAAGNPCRVIRPLTAADAEKYNTPFGK